MGPTGSGKSKLAEALADYLGAQLINADAFQVYRGLDIGTNKPVDKSKYRLLDLVEPTESFGVGQWVALVHSLLNDLWAQKRNAIIVGGTGLYIRALFEEYAEMKPAPDPEVRRILMERERSEGLGALVEELLAIDPDSSVDLKNPVRVRRALERFVTPAAIVSRTVPPFRKLKFSVNPSFEILEPKLRARVDSMLEAGWLEEVEALLHKGVPLSAPAFRAIGYQSLAGFLLGETDRATTLENIFRATRQYAKRQKTWLRSEPNLTELSVEEMNDWGISQATNEAMQILSGRGESE